MIVTKLTTLSMWSYEVYRFKNMQYEIRESFVVLAGLLLFIELIEKEKKKRTIEKSVIEVYLEDRGEDGY